MHWARFWTDPTVGLDFVAKRYMSIPSLVEMNLFVSRARSQVTVRDIDNPRYLRQ
jgi:hypothetical protein